MNRQPNIQWARYVARVLALLCGGGWAFFGLASGLGEGLTPVGVLMHTTWPGLVLLISVLIAWRWEVIGGVLLALEGVITFFVFAAGRDPLLTATLVMPPLIAGFLFITDGWSERPVGAAHI